MRISKSSLLKNISNANANINPNSTPQDNLEVVEPLPIIPPNKLTPPIEGDVKPPDEGIDEDFGVILPEPEPIIPCTCTHCKECMDRELEPLYEIECTCVYENVSKVDEEGNEYIERILKTKCQRCIDIDIIKEKYRRFELYKKAYIDEYMWDDCYYINDMIYKPIYEDEILIKTGEQVYNSVIEPKVSTKEKVDVLESSQHEQDFAIDFIMFEILPTLPDSNQPMVMSLEKSKKGGTNSMAGYLADRIEKGVVTYEFVFSVQIYKKFQDEVDVILMLDGFGHLIKR